LSDPHSNQLDSTIQYTERQTN